MSDSLVETVRFDADGLIPAVVQDAVTGDVLMLAAMNEKALRLTYATGEAHYWSRSRRELWRKGATSGHVQVVDEVRVNCERNSLLLLVRQTGAVCHDGYPTCYYRRIGADGALTIVREQAFDPASVYARNRRDSSFLGMTRSDGQSAEIDLDLDRVAEATRRQFGAYAYLRDHDLTAVSATSRRLRAPGGKFGERIADELRELAGVLDGEHRHVDRLSDLRLEASQVMYWVYLHALANGVTWARLRPDRALASSDVLAEAEMAARLLRAEAGRWTQETAPEADPAARAHATLALVALACSSGGLDPVAAVESDLAELQGRPYLAGYFGREDVSRERAAAT